MEKLQLSNTKDLQQLFKVHINQYDEGFLSKIISKRTQELNFNNEKLYVDFVQANQFEKEIFQDLLNINYSIFYRNSFTFNVLEYLIIPQLLLHKKYDSKKQIRIWSSACASGQEPYTLALVFENFKMSMNYKLNYHVFATDINQNQLKLAQNGVYRDHCLKNIPFSQFKKWFNEENNEFTIADQIKENVSYSIFDMLDQNTIAPPVSIFGDFDIIMCANVLYYYNEESRNKIFEKLISCGNKNSYFITSEVERDYFISKNFVEIYPQSAIFQNPNRG